MLVLGLLVLAVGATAGIVTAATPKKGSSYVGTLSGTSFRLEKRVVLKVSDSGTGRVRLSCSDTRIGVSSKFAIVNGKFTAVKTTGSLLVWRLRGRFASRETARANLYLPAACDGKGGKVTLELAE
ncbi:MAG: hypothetical protein H0T69_20045 [Thermoleophilaceae bacterium]|nr:hypothetical protein [Thermoleophilaceae bacterium]